MRDVSCVYRVAVKHSCQRNEEYAARYICLTTKVVIFFAYSSLLGTIFVMTTNVRLQMKGA